VSCREQGSNRTTALVVGDTGIWEFVAPALAGGLVEHQPVALGGVSIVVCSDSLFDNNDDAIVPKHKSEATKA
jgi:hypothetical protein